LNVIYATCFSHKTVQAYAIHAGLTDSKLVTRTGFNGYACEFSSVSFVRLVDYLKPDRSSLTEMYLSVQYENKADASYARSILGLAYNQNPIFVIARAAASPRNLIVYRIDSGGTWTSLGSGSASLANSTVYNIEVRWKAGDSDGVVQVWVNGTLDIDLSSQDTLPTGFTGANQWIIGCGTDSAWNTANAYIGELIVADDRIHNPFTQRKTFAILRPNGAGNNSQWTGSYSDVDEVVPDDSDGISVNTVDQVSTFGLENLPASAESVNAVILWNRIVGQGSPTPRNVQPTIRTNSNNYSGDSRPVPALRPWYGYKIWAQNPNTASAWTPNEVDALEAGAKAVT
jgi:hypothetical protein